MNGFLNVCIGKINISSEKYYNTKSFVHPYVFIGNSQEIKKNDILVADCGGILLHTIML